jgi:hypothetical protein
MRTLALGFTLSLAALLGQACTPGPVNECQCLPCEGFGLDLEVVDATDESPITDFVLEVVLNGVPQGQPEACSVEERGDSNRCQFGPEAGYYHLILTAPGYEQLELAYRYAGEGGGICCLECILPEAVRAELTPR